MAADATENSGTVPKPCDLTFGHWDKVEADIDRTFQRLQDCKGAVLAVGNHLPGNIPVDMLERYFEALLARLSIGGRLADASS